MFPIISLLVLVLDIYCLYLIIIGPGDGVKKVIWILIVLFLPVLGPLLYLIVGRG